MNDLQRKINAYFQQHPARRILFFFDGDNRHTDDVAGLTNDTFELLRLNPPYAFFGTKVKLNSRPADALPVLLYLPGQQAPRTEADRQDFPLFDLLVANDELRLDPVAEFMARYGLQTHQRPLVERYQSELVRKDPSGILQPLLRSEAFEEAALQNALTARLLGFKILPDVNSLLAKLLTDRADRPAEQANYLIRLEQLNLDASLRRRIADVFFDGPVTEPITSGFVQQLVLRLKYNLMVSSLPTDGEPYPMLRLNRTDTLSRLTVVRETIGAAPLERLLTKVGEAVHEEKLLARYGATARYGYYSTRLRELLLKEIMLSSKPSISPGSQLSTLDELLIDVPDIHPQRLLLLAVRHGFSLLEAIGNVITYRLDTPEAYIKTYEETFYRIDLLYRWFVQARRDWQIVASDDSAIGTAADEIAEWLTPFEQRIYERYDRFLLELNESG